MPKGTVNKEREEVERLAVAYMQEHPGIETKASDVAKAIGKPSRATIDALGYITGRDERARRTGGKRATIRYPHLFKVPHKAALYVWVTPDQAPPITTPTPAEVTVATESDDELWEVLDLLTGDVQIKLTKDTFAAVEDWMDATRNLLTKLRGE